MHLAKAEDFFEFKNVWKEFFPENPPARTTVEVGDTFPFRGVLLSIDAIALSGASKLERVSLSAPEGADPLAKSTCLSSLSALHMDSTGLGDQGVKAIAASQTLSKIEKLYLCSNKIGDEGAIALSQSPNLSHLTCLSV